MSKNRKELKENMTLETLLQDGWTLEEMITALNVKMQESNPQLQDDKERMQELKITKIIRELGIPANMIGYKYLRTAIKEVIKDENLMDAVTKELYPRVANLHATTSSKVERGIRHAIESAWKRCDIEIKQKYFWQTISRNKNKPTNSEFIAIIADNVCMDSEK